MNSTQLFAFIILPILVMIGGRFFADWAIREHNREVKRAASR